MATVQVIGPEEMLSHWQKALPDAVVETFNEELARLFDGKSASLREKDLLAILKKKHPQIGDVQERGWLRQASELYKERGWKMTLRDCGDDYTNDFYYLFALP